MKNKQAIKIKRKRKKILRSCIGVGLILCLGACTGYYFLFYQKQTESSEIVVTAGENEEILLAQIDSISGNEITYTLVEAVDMSSMMHDRTDGMTEGSMEEDGIEADSSANRTGGMMPSGGFRGGDTASAEGSHTATDDVTSYQLLDETETTLIPVGTVVTTKLGTETTFSRLAAGDVVKLVVNTTADNEIDAVYIID